METKKRPVLEIRLMIIIAKDLGHKGTDIAAAFGYKPTALYSLGGSGHYQDTLLFL